MAGQHLDPAGDCTGSLPLPKTSQIHCAFDPEYHRHLPGDSGRPLDLFPLGGEQKFKIFLEPENGSICLVFVLNEEISLEIGGIQISTDLERL